MGTISDIKYWDKMEYGMRALALEEQSVKKRNEEKIDDSQFSLLYINRELPFLFSEFLDERSTNEDKTHSVRWIFKIIMSYYQIKKDLQLIGVYVPQNYQTDITNKLNNFAQSVSKWAAARN